MAVGDAEAGKAPDDGPGSGERTSVRLFAVGFRLAGDVAGSSPDLILKAAQGDDVAKAVERALRDEAEKLLKAKESSASEEAGNFVLRRIGADVTAAVVKDVQKQVKASQDFKDLEKELEELQKELKEQPLGTWIVRNAELEILTLYVVGAIACVGGVVFYYTRSIDPMTKLLEGKSLDFKMAGDIEVTAGITKLRPSTGQYGGSLKMQRGFGDHVTAAVDVKGETGGSAGPSSAEGTVTVGGKWERVEAEVRLQGVFDGENKHWNVEGEVTTTLGVAQIVAKASHGDKGLYDYTAAVGVKVTASGVSAELSANVEGGEVSGKGVVGYTGGAFELQVQSEVTSGGKFKGAADLSYKGNVTKELPFKIGVQGEANYESKSGWGYGGMMKVEVRFP
jgi:hypothetical protein